MKQINKEKSNSKQKNSLKKTNNNSNNSKNNNNNPFFPIKYFCFNEVKKIVNNKNKKSPLQNKTNEKLQPNKKRENTKKEEEDDYCKNIYVKKLKVPHNISSINLRKKNLYLNKIEINTNNNQNYNHCINNNSYDERYKTINKFGYYTKKILCVANMMMSGSVAWNGNGTFGIGLKKSKFGKINKKMKKNIRNKKISNQNNNYLDIHDITNMNNNNIIYRSNNINESNNTITSNTVTSKTITNNTMSNYTLSNITPSSYYNKTNNTNNTNSNIIDYNNLQNINNNKDYVQMNQNNDSNNNIKVIRNKGRNKNININNNIIKEIKKKNVKKKNKEKVKENTVFIRRIILEEKFTIDSKGDKKTIYIKKISPIMKLKDPAVNSADKRLIKNKKLIKNNNNNNNKNYNNKKDNTFINHNDINLNFNVCSFQKINVKDNVNVIEGKKEKIISKLESFDENDTTENNLINSNNDISENTMNDSIIKNYHNFLNIKTGNKIIYQKPNSMIYKTENNHKSYQSLFSNPSKKYIIHPTCGNNCERQKKPKNNKKIANNIKKNSTNDFDNNKIPLKYIITNQRFLKNKMVHRKNKSNYIMPKKLEKEEESQSNYDYIAQYEEIDNDNIDNIDNIDNSAYKRSLSFIGKTPVYKIFKKNKKIDINDKLDINNNSNNNNHTINAIISSKIHEYSLFSPQNTSSITSKKNTKLNSVNNSKYIKKLKKNNRLNNIMNESCEKNSRSHSLGKIKGHNNYNSNDIQVFIDYLKNNMNNNNNNNSKGRNKSHRNFIIKKKQKYDLNDLINEKNKKSNNKKVNCTNMIYFKNKAKKKVIKK